ncbi:hypothetical protein GE061_003046 [Apolygus lucorum]|uniref:Uncharacterized protein n=1 Tax=Apolygus lucorum TaxID=248454 RepID=A0A8S9X0Z6_APOLU|nr:hypothetical protein GE061_003046 [Apolygus lucorum]
MAYLGLSSSSSSFRFFSKPAQKLALSVVVSWIHIKRELKKILATETSCSSIAEIPKGYATLGKGEGVKLWNIEWTVLKFIPTEFTGFCNIVFCGALLLPGSDERWCATL